MRTPDVHLVEMAHPPIARGDGDVLELNVHVVFGCNARVRSAPSSNIRPKGKCGVGDLRARTFEELAAIHLARGDLEGNDMALEGNRVSKDD